MKYCQRLNCSPLNILFNGVYNTLMTQGVPPSLQGVKQGRGGQNKLFSS